MSIVWNTGLAAARARHNLKLKKKTGPQKKHTSKQQASKQRASKKELDSYEIPDIKDL